MTADQNSDGEQTEHKRRLRYRGTHPRSFVEKYKELNADKYAADVAHIMSRGQTPAGTHRPICVKEILEVLNPKDGETGLDATLGWGGHTRELAMKILPTGRLFAIDVDPIELPKTEARLRGFGLTDANLIIRRINFAGISQIVNEAGTLFDFVLADLGVSSMQIDTPSRGFTYKADGPLDLRLNPNKGLSAAALIRKLSADELAEILADYSDEPESVRIASAIVANASSIDTTRQLAAAITDAVPRMVDSQKRKTLQRVFQALRIAVNDEFAVLEQFLTLLPYCVKPQARIAILTFHSGEDRRVKKSFQEGFRSGIYSDWSREPIRPSAEEQRENPRSSCAKLRWAIKA